MPLNQLDGTISKTNEDEVHYFEKKSIKTPGFKAFKNFPTRWQQCSKNNEALLVTFYAFGSAFSSHTELNPSPFCKQLLDIIIILCTDKSSLEYKLAVT